MDVLHNKIQNELEKFIIFQRHGKKDLCSLVTFFKALYNAVPRETRKDNMVPFSDSCLRDDPIVFNDNLVQYEFNYRWNKGKNSEFVLDSIEKGIIIPKGTILDRVGADSGSYLSPVSMDREAYTASERALPYYLIEPSITIEPAYHRYKVRIDISKEAIIQAILNNQDVFKDESTKNGVLVKAQTREILFGKVAPVEAFTNQGTGNGYQYKSIIAVYYLRALNFIEEI